MNLKFFVEDKAHVKFLTDFVSEHFAVSLNEQIDFYKLDGWSGYKKGGVALPDYLQNSDNGIINITFLDADTNFNTRKSEVLTDFHALGIISNLFLFPNNSEKGEIEVALINIAIDRKIITCFEAYESCIEGYEKPVNKSKVYAYLDALLETKNKKNNKKDLIEEKNRNYKNHDHWNLYHEYLDPLKDFLTPFFI